MTFWDMWAIGNCDKQLDFSTNEYYLENEHFDGYKISLQVKMKDSH